MEAEYNELKAFPSFKHRTEAAAEAAAISRHESETDETPRYQKLRSVASFKHVIESSAAEISREGSENDELPRYTSLKDVMAAETSSPRGGAGAAEPGNIAIRNELVKHAASAYVLSATIIMPENRGRDSRIKLCCVGFVSCWRIRVGLPSDALCWPLVDFFYLVVRRVRTVFRVESRRAEIRH
ncbi:hypothetical protein C2S52_018961 [Perilla frutescens var. hirtella]|nr:hypothetical protein C2S52_018961 [Perilla frutescens var. hirtella]